LANVIKLRKKSKEQSKTLLFFHGKNKTRKFDKTLDKQSKKCGGSLLKKYFRRLYP